MRWFKHDSDANSDAKLRKVRLKYGMAGYGLYWYCIEHIVGNIELHNLTFELEHDAEILAFDTGISREVIQEMMAYMVDLGLFEMSSGVVTCLKVAKRLDQSMTSNTEMRSKIKDIHKLIPDRVMTVSCQSHDGIMQEENRIEENRIEDIQAGLPDGKSSSNPPIPYSKIIDLYHQKLPMLPSVARLNTTRKTKIRLLWNQDMDDLDSWDSYFDYVAKSKFLTGQVQPPNGRKVFRADIDWLINSHNAIKIEEGKYHG